MIVINIETHTTHTFTLNLNELELDTVRCALERYRDSLRPEDNAGHSVTDDVNELLAGIATAFRAWDGPCVWRECGKPGACTTESPDF